MWNAGLDEAQAGIKIPGRNISNLRYVDDTTPMAESEKEQKSLLIRVKEESEEADLKLNTQKTKIMASSPITSWQIGGGGEVGVGTYFIFLCSLLCCVQLFVTPWIVAHQAPLSMKFSRQEYWSGSPLPSPGDFSDPRIKLGSSALQAASLPSEPPLFS